ncbi:MAG: lipid-A-disaccharide synthase [Bacteroidetes bacterium]|nr:lipid-A-disaccharide synthase [Bacteroidota bacterium]
MAKRVMIIAGEASGDLHGSGVVRELKRLSPDIDVYGVGGDKMKREGMENIYHINELGFMGFTEVIKHLPFIKAMEHTLEQIVKFKRPDVLVLIDYPGFNLRFARIAKRYGVKIVYYISPQIWAWHKSRVKKMRPFVDKMLVIFPFEVDYYRAEGIDVEFVGHPLLENLESTLDRKNFCRRFGLSGEKQIIALLPGSRKQEIERIFPAMLGAAGKIAAQKEIEIIIGIAPTIDEKYFRTLYNIKGIHLISNLTYDVMDNADFAFVTSGTATLETACFGTPMFVVYKTSLLTYLIGRMLVNLKNIGLVNIVAGKTIVPEFIQKKVNAKELAKSALELLNNEKRMNDMKAELAKVKGLLGSSGASSKAAECILKMSF